MRKGINPRWQNANLRRKYQARFRAMDAPCGICHGLLGRIHYEEPSDPAHPLSFVIDEIIPISRYKEGGFDSPREAAEAWTNLQAAHRCCNAWKKDRINFRINIAAVRKIQKDELDGDW